MDFTAKVGRKNPFVKASIVSRIFFIWMIPLFWEGKKKDLILDDLYDPLKDDLAAKIGNDLEAEWTRRLKVAKQKNKAPSLVGALFAILGKQYMIGSIGLVVGELVFAIAQPIVLRELITSFSDSAKTSKRDQYLLAVGLSIATIGTTLCFHPCAFYLYRISMRCRCGLSSLIFRKAIRLSTCAAYQKTNVGAVVNLLSNDVNKFDQNLIWISFIPIGIIQLLAFSYLLWNELGLPGLSGVAALAIIMPFQYFNGRLSGKYRLQIAVRTDERGRVMNEIITGIRILKMYAWEAPFSFIIHHLRKLETVALRKRLFVRGTYFCLYSAAPRFLSFVTILAYLWTGNDLTAEKVYFASTIYYILTFHWISSIPSAISGLGEIFVSLNRIITFLQLEEKVTSENFLASDAGNTRPQINLQSISAQWTQGINTLSNVSASLSGDKVVCIVGQCGSGKSSLLHVLLGELPVTHGKVAVQGQMSYAAQEPWIFTGSVRQNILFGRPFVKEKYEECVEVACLLDDFKQFSHGDRTLVGERGVSLSGGQKARVSLARCLYQEADIYILDDPLSAVDTKVSRSLFENCIRKYLHGKLRILVTHQLQYLPQADYIIVVKDGGILAQGSYQELVDANVDFLSLLVKEDSNDEDNNRAERQASISTTTTNPETEDGVTSDFKVNDSDEKLKKEESSRGSVGAKLYINYFRMGRSYFLLFLTIFIFILCQVSLNAVDYFLSFWTNAEVEPDESSSTYLGRNTYVYIYTGLISFAVANSLLRSFLFLNYTTRIGINVHDAMFSSLVRAKMKFFDENPSGRVMNRFTKDLGSMDEVLPPAMMDMLTIVGQVIGVVVVVVVSNYYMAVPAVFIFLLLWVVRGYYVKTTRDVKRIEGISVQFTVN